MPIIIRLFYQQYKMRVLINRTLIINLSQNIYPILAQKYQKTCISIKTSIFQSISIMYYEIEEDKLFSYLGYYSNKKPKAKDIIYAILQKL